MSEPPPAHRTYYGRTRKMKGRGLMLQLGLKTVPMIGTHTIVTQFDMWILHGQLIILFIHSIDGHI